LARSLLGRMPLAGAFFMGHFLAFGRRPSSLGARPHLFTLAPGLLGRSTSLPDLTGSEHAPESRTAELGGAGGKPQPLLPDGPDFLRGHVMRLPAAAASASGEDRTGVRRRGGRLASSSRTDGPRPPPVRRQFFVLHPPCCTTCFSDFHFDDCSLS
jgi:hypothetical protein